MPLSAAVDSPYAPPAPEPQPPPLPPIQAGLPPPAALMFFGIANVVIGLIDVGLAALAFVRPWYNPRSQPKTGTGMAVNELRQNAAYNLGSGGAALLLAALALIAGFRLINGHRNALPSANRYAWVSLIHKVLHILLISYLLSRILPVAGSGEMSSRQRTWMMIAPFASALMMMIYPILSLILLNRPFVKDWLSANGK